MPFGFFFDPTYVLLIPALIFALWAQWKVQKTYAKYSKVRAANGRTGREIASAIMARNGVTDVSIEWLSSVITLDPGDVYQAFLYAYAYRTSDSTTPAAALVYPSETGATRPTRLRIRTETGPPGAQIVALGLPVQSVLDELTTGRPGPLLSDLGNRLTAMFGLDIA